ncbi:MAG: DUF1302 family protein [Bacillota bacterium]
MRRSLVICIIASLLLFSSSLTALAAGAVIGGELTQSLGYDFDNEEISAAITDYSIYLERGFGMDGKVYLSLKGKYNALDETHEIDLDEAFASAYLKDIDITVGKQAISWGTADGINPTSNINPIGFSLTDSQIKGKPILAAQATYYGDNFDVTGVVVPAFVPLQLSDLGSLADNEMIDVIKGLTIPLPANDLSSMEWAVKFGTYLSGYDLQASYFHGWEDIPALVAKLSIDPTTMQPKAELEGKYRRVDVVGLAVAGVLGDFGVWAEGAYVVPEKLDLEPSSPLEPSKMALSPNEPYIQAVIGADHTFDNGIYAQAQYIYWGNGSLTMPYKTDPTAETKPGHYLSNHLSYSFDMKNSLELISLVNLRDKTAALVPTYTHSLTQATSLKIGVAAFVGTNGEFSGLPTQVTLQLRTVF